MTAVLLALLLLQDQRPNTLVEVALIGTGQRVTVEAILTADSVLLFPARELHLLLGLPAPTTAWVTTADPGARLSQRYLDLAAARAAAAG